MPQKLLGRNLVTSIISDTVTVTGIILVLKDKCVFFCISEPQKSLLVLDQSLEK